MKKYFIFLSVISSIFSICYSENYEQFKGFSLTGVLGYTLPMSPTGSNSYSESYFPGFLFGAGGKYSFSNNFSVGLFYEGTSTSHRTDPSAKVSFSPICLEGLASIASTDNERIFLIGGAGYSKNKVEGSKIPSEWNSIVFIAGGGFEYLISKKIGFEVDLKGFGFLPESNDYDMLGISSLLVLINLYL